MRGETKGRPKSAIPVNHVRPVREFWYGDRMITLTTRILFFYNGKRFKIDKFYEPRNRIIGIVAIEFEKQAVYLIPASEIENFHFFSPLTKNGRYTYLSNQQIKANRPLDEHSDELSADQDVGHSENDSR